MVDGPKNQKVSDYERPPLKANKRDQTNIPYHKTDFDTNCKLMIKLKIFVEVKITHFFKLVNTME
jgi:hypothetical protein